MLVSALWACTFSCYFNVLLLYDLLTLWYDFAGYYVFGVLSLGVHKGWVFMILLFVCTTVSGYGFIVS